MANNATALKKNGSQDAAAGTEMTRGLWFTPRVDIMETDEELTLFADLPGAKQGNVDIRYEKGELHLQASCPIRQEATNYMLNEYGVGDFYRSFTISQDIDASRIAAELKNGVLTVHLPKTEAVKPKKIQVKGE